MHSHIDFGYAWQWNYGHLVVAAIAAALCLLALTQKWHKLLLALFGALTLWSFTAFLLVRFGFDMNGRMALPTQSFLAAGSGTILDMGAGTGRSALMVLEARPKTTLVALDSFSTEYVQHFGADGKAQEVPDVGRQRLLANFRAAGVEQRATIQPGDMRHMPFPSASFDGIVSAYAIDHLNSAGVRSALSEASRVLKPGGEFLLIVIAKDVWLKFTFGPILMHAATRAPDRWDQLLEQAGFQMVEQGKRPATLYFLTRKR
jgi:ubiquinone/menaquinone biosynthesis C-methylase UbiE